MKSHGTITGIITIASKRAGLVSKNATSTLAIAALLAAPLMLSPLSASADAGDADFAKKMDTYLSQEANVDKVGGVLLQFLQKKQKEQQASQAKAEEKEFEEQLKNPVAIEIGKSPVKGPKDAWITVVEFSDFQCPYCQRGASVMDELVKKYPTELKLAFKHLPLPFHPEAKPAARAAIAAGNQGKFWEMHDKLFTAQQGLGEATFTKFAEELKLDMAKFKADYAAPETAKQVEDDMAIANKLGVQGTPGFFVNGVQVRGARPAQFFEQLIEKLRKDKKA